MTHEKSADDYGITDKSHTAHIRAFPGVSMCGKKIIGPVPTGDKAWKDSLGYHDGQHCIDCDAAYRARYGSVAVTYDF